MKYLLDTNALLFWLEGSKRLPKAVREKLVDPNNHVYVSVVSAFEIAVKVALKRLSLPGPPSAVLSPFFEQSGLTPLPVTMDHSFGVSSLPMHHADPFDRLLISQAICDDLSIVTSNRDFANYAVKLVLIR